MIYITPNKAINFRHYFVDSSDANVSKRVTNANLATSRITECEIVNVDGEEIVEVLGKGTSRCHPMDNFNKEFGRKNALARAISNMSRADRTVIWNAYFNR
jgi:hypothetical protein